MGRLKVLKTARLVRRTDRLVQLVVHSTLDSGRIVSINFKTGNCWRGLINMCYGVDDTIGLSLGEHGATVTIK